MWGAERAAGESHRSVETNQSHLRSTLRSSLQAPPGPIDTLTHSLALIGSATRATKAARATRATRATRAARAARASY